VSAPPDPRAAAHAYLDRGFTPIGWYIGRDNAKVAIGRGWTYRDYSCTHADIDRWPKCQTGLVMSQRSGYFALDFDCGQKRAAEFFEEYQPNPTAIQITRRGFHMVYRGSGIGGSWPRDGVWSAGWMDVQVRSNGFIAAAPSVHPSGFRYRWAGDRMPEMASAILMMARPDRAAPRHGSGRGRDDGLDGELTDYAQHGIPVGWQDTELYRLACKHVRTMGHEELSGWLWACAEASVQNPLNPWRPQDIRNKIRRAAEFTRWSDAASASRDAHLVRLAAEMEAASHGW
jgi:hypothetical protein